MRWDEEGANFLCICRHRWLLTLLNHPAQAWDSVIWAYKIGVQGIKCGYRCETAVKGRGGGDVEGGGGAPGRA